MNKPTKTIILLILSTIFLLICVGVGSASDADSILLNMSFNNFTVTYNNTYAADTSGYNNFGNVSIGSGGFYTNESVNNRYYGAYYFDNGSTYFNISNSSASINNISNSTNWTISIWFYDKDKVTNRFMLFKDGSWGIGVVNSRLRFTERKTGNDYVEVTDSSLEVQNNKWTNAIISYNTIANSRFKMYINGVNGTMSFSDASKPYYFNGTLGNLNINRNRSSDGWTGYLDEILFFNKTLSQSEVNNLFSSYKRDFYFSNSGSDSNNCLTQSNACQTITKMNTLQLFGGDNVNFKRGDTFRLYEQSWINVSSGNSISGHITYKDYGVGNKPIFKGGPNAMSTSNWTNNGVGNLWYWTGQNFTGDVGNIWYNSYSLMAYNKTNYTEALVRQGQFMWNTTTGNLTIYSVSNPATFYSSIEISAQKAWDEALFMADDIDYVSIINLSFMSGGSHGIYFINHVNATIDSVDVAYMGGAYYTPSTKMYLRYGNGITTGLDSANVTVKNCNITYSWDTDISPQAWSTGGTAIISNHLYQNNTIRAMCEPYDYFSSLPYSNTSNIIMDHNTFIYDSTIVDNYPSIECDYDQSIRLSRTSGNTTNFNFTNNIFYSPNKTMIWMGNDATTSWNGTLWFNRNYHYYLPSQVSHPYNWNNTEYHSFSEWSLTTGMDLLGMYGNPQFNNFAAGDYRPTNGTACFMGKNGTYVGAVPCDYNGNYTITLNRSGQIVLNYPKIKNVSYMEGDVIAFGRIPTNYSLYNVTRGETVFTHSPTFTLRVNPNEQYEVSEEGTCLYMAENFTVNRSTTVCNKWYNINDTENNGAILINGNNINLTCNGATLNGSGTGIKESSKNNINITGCNLFKYSSSIWLDRGYNITLNNLNITNTSRGIYFYKNNLSALYNSSINARLGTASGGIVLYQSNYTIISNNTIQDTGSYGVNIGEFSNNNTVSYNIIKNLGDSITNAHGIYNDRHNTSDNKYYFNYIYNTGWNGIDINYRNNKAINNTIINSYHHGIDLYDSVDDFQQIYNNLVENNTITWTTTAYDNIGIYMNNASFNLIKNNFISNVYSATPDTTGFGIALSGYNSTTNNITNNYINGCSSYGISTTGKNSSIQNNYLINNLRGIRISSYDGLSNATDYFIDNLIYGNNLEYVFKYGSYINISVLSNTNQINKLNLSFHNGMIYMLSSTYKNYRIDNKTYYLWNLTKTPYQTYQRVLIFNSTISDIAKTSVEYYNATLNPNNRTLIYQLETSTQPYPTYISTNISEMTYDWDGSTLTIECTGTNQVPWNLTNMNAIGSTYKHYINGAYVESLTANDIQVTSCSTHTFTTGGSVAAYSPEGGRIINSLIIPFTILGILAVMIYPVTSKKYEEWDEEEWVAYFIKAMIILGVGIATVLFLANI